MAKAVAICRCKTCGSEFKATAVKQNRSLADSWEAWAERTFDECDECRQKRIAEERAKATEEAAEYAKEAELPELTGTPKQIAWAETIRAEYLAKWQDFLDKERELAKTSERHAKRLDQYIDFGKWLSGKTESRFWIDNRDWYEIRSLYDSLSDRFVDEVRKAEIEAEKPAPTIIEPEEKKSATICLVEIDRGKVTVRSTKDQGVITLVKKYGYRWNGSVWAKEITETTGTAEERLIEIANRLLVAGFPVRVAPEYQERVINAQYEPETNRWIEVEKAGVLRITGLTNEAGKIHGADVKQWKGYTLVPASAWNEVEEFARLHDFRFTTGATKEIENYKAKIITVSPTKGTEAEYHEKDTKSILESSRDVLDDLREEE